VYAAKCQACHGEKGTGKPADPLVGGIGTLASASPVRTVGSYWPHATTLFDYTRRAMPTNAPRTLTDDEVYAVTAYVLYLNGIIGETHTLNAETLPQVKMPNRSGFVDRSHAR
jgi:cytochrome c